MECLECLFWTFLNKVEKVIHFLGDNVSTPSHCGDIYTGLCGLVMQPYWLPYCKKNLFLDFVSQYLFWYSVFLFTVFLIISCAKFIRVYISCTYSFTSGASSISFGFSLTTCKGNVTSLPNINMLGVDQYLTVLRTCRPS